MQAILKWLAGALATVYADEGVVGVAVVVGLLLLTWWLFGNDIMRLITG